MSAMQPLVDFASLVTFLETNQIPHAVNREAQLVELPSKAAPMPGNLIIKWEKTKHVVSMIQFMFDDVPADRLRDIETAIVRINCAIEMPGIGFDHARSRIFYRVVAPVLPPEGITPASFNQLGQACVRLAKDLYPSFKAIIEGRAGDQIMSFASDMAATAQASEKPAGGAQA